MRADSIFRQQVLLDAEERLLRARRSVEAQRAWLAAHPHHPDVDAARRLLERMEALLVECERTRDTLAQAWLSQGRR